jgi:predicted short-subunit dehydrogenase-like oxidoreductase (DUF2520 family)
MTLPRRIGIIGVGRLGSCLARALQHAGLPLTALASARLDRAQALCTELGAQASVRAVQVTEIGQHAELIFLAVPDASVREVCAQLPLAAAHALVHMSGARDLSELAAAAALGAQVGVLHPLQAFPPGAGAERFAGIHVGVDASDPVLAGELQALIGALGATPLSLQGVDRAAYHAAAVLVSNYVVALHAAAARAWTLAGLPPDSARAALAPLTAGAAHAVAHNDLAIALTGPVARGDSATVAGHLQALSNDLPLTALYRALARELLALPLTLTPEARAALSALCAEPGQSPAVV